MTKIFCDRCEELIPNVSFSETVTSRSFMENEKIWFIRVKFLQRINGDERNTTICSKCRKDLLTLIAGMTE